jgi:hypothetical protein
MGNPQCHFGVRGTTYCGTGYQRPGRLATIVLAGQAVAYMSQASVRRAGRRRACDDVAWWPHGQEVTCADAVARILCSLETRLAYACFDAMC